MAGGGFSSDDDLIGGINVTPLVDVVLVLLIIFMITAPAIYQSAIKVDLPKARSGETTEASPLQFALSADGTLNWNRQPQAWEGLEDRLRAKKSELEAKGSSELQQTAAISADQKTPHGTVVRLMDALRQAGFTRFALNVDAEAPKR